MGAELPYRSALVTGASRGIGAAIVEALRAEGLAVWAVARSRDALEALARASGCVALPLDLTDTPALERALAPLAIDVLIVNAGRITSLRPFTEASRYDVDAVLDLNLKAAMHTVRVVLPGMIARKRGHILFISSIAAHTPYPRLAAYCASKAALSMFAQSLRLDLLGTGIRVSEINPGRVRTDIYLEALGDKSRVEEQLYRDIRPLEPAEVARVVMTALRLPEHVDLARIDLLPTDQAVGGIALAPRSEQAHARESSQR